MSCLTIEKLYAYLDGDLAGREKKAVDEHLASCASCRCALEARRRLAQAAETLPAFEVPADFARGVLERIPVAEAPERAKKKSRGWWVALASGFATFVVSLVGTALLTGHTLPQLLPALNRFLWSNIQGIASILAKGAKLVVLTFEVLLQIAGKAFEVFKALTSLIGPEAQVVLAVAAAVIVIGCGFFWSRRYQAERNHEEP